MSVSICLDTERDQLEARAREVMAGMEAWEIAAELAHARPPKARLENWLLEAIDDRQLADWVKEMEEL